MAGVKYLLIVRAEEPAPGAEPALPSGCEGWSEDLEQSGKLLAGGILQPSRIAATVRVREGRALRTDGPFTEAKEMIAGFNLIECDSMDEAVEIAAGHPVTRTGAIEIRQIRER